tara:strand:+ start:304 stop:627 length:324 start_codon:yes stop_codon:yes gene_type:complete
MKSKTTQYVEKTVQYGNLKLHLYGEMDADGTTVVEPRTWEYPGSRDTTIDWKSLGFGGIITLETDVFEVEFEVDMIGKDAELLLNFFKFYPDEIDEENWEEIEDFYE